MFSIMYFWQIFCQRIGYLRSLIVSLSRDLTLVMNYNIYQVSPWSPKQTCMQIKRSDTWNIEGQHCIFLNSYEGNKWTNHNYMHQKFIHCWRYFPFYLFVSACSSWKFPKIFFRNPSLESQLFIHPWSSFKGHWIYINMCMHNILIKPPLFFFAICIFI